MSSHEHPFPFTSQNESLSRHFFIRIHWSFYFNRNIFFFFLLCSSERRKGRGGSQTVTGLPSSSSSCSSVNYSDCLQSSDGLWYHFLHLSPRSSYLSSIDGEFNFTNVIVISSMSIVLIPCNRVLICGFISFNTKVLCKILLSYVQDLGENYIR